MYVGTVTAPTGQDMDPPSKSPTRAVATRDTAGTRM